MVDLVVAEDRHEVVEAAEGEAEVEDAAEEEVVAEEEVLVEGADVVEGAVVAEEEVVAEVAEEEGRTKSRSNLTDIRGYLYLEAKTTSC